MKSITLVFLLGVVGLIGLTQAAEDYCSKSLCQPGEKHIGCKHSGEFAKTCPKEKKMIKVDESMKKLIIDVHNSLRNKVAGGTVPGFKGAKRMATMTWDNEMAKLAEFNVMSCEMEHDECHDTKTFKFSGQNLAQSFYSGSEPKVTDVVEELIVSWFEEHKDANMDVIQKYPRNWTGEDIGHFTAMVNDENIKAGCAISWFYLPDEDFKSYLMACNYATTNMIGKNVYADGTPASECKTGKNPVYKNLCSSKEQY